MGVPLPLISYGGTSIISLLIGFGLIMSMQRTKRVLQGSRDAHIFIDVSNC